MFIDNSSHCSFAYYLLIPLSLITCLHISCTSIGIFNSQFNNPTIHLCNNKQSKSSLQYPTSIHRHSLLGLFLIHSWNTLSVISYHFTHSPHSYLLKRISRIKSGNPPEVSQSKRDTRAISPSPLSTPGDYDCVKLQSTMLSTTQSQVSLHTHNHTLQSHHCKLSHWHWLHTRTLQQPSVKARVNENIHSLN